MSRPDKGRREYRHGALGGYRRRSVIAILTLLLAYGTVSTVSSLIAVDTAGGMPEVAQHLLIQFGVGLLAMFLVVGFLTVLVIEDRVARGLRLLIAGARRLADGDLEHRIEIQSRDEIGELSDAFNRMATGMRVTVEGLQRSDERLRAILESAADGIVLLDPTDGRVIELNKRFATMAGREPSELAGSPIWAFATGLTSEDLARLARRIDWGERVEAMRSLFKRPDGSEIPVETTASLASAGGRALLLLVVRDVSEREALEAEIRSNNEKLRHLFGVATRLRRTRDLDEQTQIIVDGVREAGWGRAVLYLYRDGWNLEKVAFSGFKQSEMDLLSSGALAPEDRRKLFEEVLPRYRIGNCYFVPGDAQGALEVFQTVLPSNMSPAESLGWHPDDSLLIPLEGRDGRILASISVDDPVDRKRPTTDSLRILELFAAAAGATFEEDRSHSQLVRAERLKALGEMAGGVAHDFNNILGAILGRAQLLMMRTQDSEMRRSLDVIEKAARDGAETVKRIQEFTRLRQDHAFIVTDLSDLVRDTLEITRSRWRDEAEATGIRYEISVQAPPGLFILGHPSELREVLTNLVLNALDAMPKGGKLALSASKGNGEVRLKVQDDGHGMTEEVRNRVFDPYFTTKGVRGTGLGLSVSYGIARRHGGDILVESRLGHGTTFTVIFPAGAQGPAPESIRPALSMGHGRILAVDDEEQVRGLLEEILTVHGHEVIVASDGEQGLEIYGHDGPFDVVITDLGMPGMSGRELARRIHDLDPAARIILSTGWGGTLEHERLKGSGVSRVLAKPFDMRDLLTALEDELAFKRAGTGAGGSRPRDERGPDQTVPCVPAGVSGRD